LNGPPDPRGAVLGTQGQSPVRMKVCESRKAEVKMAALSMLAEWKTVRNQSWILPIQKKDIVGTRTFRSTDDNS